MSWVKIDDQFADHPKVVMAGDLAGWMYLAGLCWVNRHLTDGFIPAGQTRKLSTADNPDDLAARLVEVGLWERTAGGYLIHDYHDHYPSAESVKAKRKAEQERKAKGRADQGRDESGRITSGHPESVQPDSARTADRTPAGSPPVPTSDFRLPTSESESEVPPVSPPKGDGSHSKPEKSKAAKTKAAATAKWRPVATEVLSALNEARKRVIPGALDLGTQDGNLEHICGRLEDGYSAADCLHVVEVCEAEVRAGGDPVWFDTCTPFRKSNFPKRVAMSVDAIGRPRGNGARASPVTVGRTEPGPADTESRIDDF